MERLLIRLPNWLGDALMARPLLHALRRHFPGARRVAVGPAGLLEALAVEDPELETHAWPGTSGEKARLAETLRANRPDAALVLPASFSSAWFAWRSGARRRVGYAAEGRTPLLTDALRRPPRGERHLSEEYAALGERLGAAPVTPPPLAPAEAWRTAAGERLVEAGVGSESLAVLAPGAAYGPAKRWAPERFARLGDSLAARGLAVVLVGAAEDRAACEDVATRMRSPVASLCGKTSLAELTAVCARASLVVSNDSGVAHLAAATGTRTVAIFGSTSSAWTAPLGPDVRVVRRAPPCAPCFRRSCAIGYRCLTAVEVADLERAAGEPAA